MATGQLPKDHPDRMNRRSHAFDLREQGRTYAEIAAILGIATDTAYRDVYETRQERGLGPKGGKVRRSG